jgi:hypothetical protein
METSKGETDLYEIYKSQTSTEYYILVCRMISELFLDIKEDIGLRRLAGSPITTSKSH